MIQKIQSLVSIGKFRNYQASGDVTFKKLTLLYGDNGSGKTTLTSILRSLTVNNPDIVKRRKSINEVTNQAAQIVSNTAGINTFHTFHHSNGWTSTHADIEVFDIHFVNDNVYSGFDFTDEHKKKLHQFVIGAQGVLIQQQIQQNKDEKKTIRITIGAIEQELIQSVAGLTSAKLLAFLSLTATSAADIDTKIASAEAALVSANANTTLRTLPRLDVLPRLTVGFNLAGIINDLPATPQTVLNETLESLFVAHSRDLSENSFTRTEAWLHGGHKYVLSQKERGVSLIKCPFCKQQLDDNMDILKAYAGKFDGSFNDLTNRIQEYNTSILQYNLSQKLRELKTAVRINGERMASWSNHLPSNVLTPTFDIQENETLVGSQFLQLKQNVQTKFQNPSSAIVVDAAEEFRASVIAINRKIDEYNSGVSTYNHGIVNFLGGIQTSLQAQANLHEVNLIKRRFEPNTDALCASLMVEKANLRALDLAYPQLVQQQETAAAAFFVTYRNRINHYLQTVFKTMLKIDRINHVRPQGQATQSKLAYTLTIDGADISFDETQPMNAKDSLSEGDKSTIALAFFLSKLDIDPGVNAKIVVFDDPLSSFDLNRRMNTVQLIRDLFPSIKQLIVSSHNEHFLYEIYKHFPPASKKSLRITQNFLTKASIIEPLDLELLVKNDYFKHVDELNEFLQHPNIARKEDILGKLRNVLEAHLRFKFYRQLSVISPNGQTFGALITALTTQNVVFRNNTATPEILARLNLINGISCRPHHGEPMPDYATLGRDPATINITELSGFVADTLTLIDTEL